MTERKLASVRRIAEILPIEGADRIVLAKVDGWQVVTQKGWCNPGDLVCYFEIDSFLPVRPEYEFLRKSGFKSTKNLGDGFRLKTIKLKGQLSQGLIMPLEEVLPEGTMDCLGPFSYMRSCIPPNHWIKTPDEWVGKSIKDLPTEEMLNAVNNSFRVPHEEGADLTELLGVKLYEKPIPAQLAGRIRGNFPMFVRKTDQERCQNLKRQLEEAWDNNDVFEVTKKLDGSSMTVYCRMETHSGGYQVGVCSRNWDLDEALVSDEKPSAFWAAAYGQDLLAKIQNIAHDREKLGLPFELALQGELMGPGIQQNRESFTGIKFFLFDVWDIQNQCYLTPKERADLARVYNIQEVPNFAILPLQDLVKSRETIIQDLLALAECPSINNPVAEGLVFKRVDGKFSFKAISNKYLLGEKDD